VRLRARPKLWNGRKGIRRAWGSHVAQLKAAIALLDADPSERDPEVLKLFGPLGQSELTLVGHAVAAFQALAVLKAEAGALAARFDLPAPDLPLHLLGLLLGDAYLRLSTRLTSAAQRAPAREEVPRYEEDEFEIRRRRSYQEVAGTEAFAIIMAAGLAPWPPLTESQQKAAVARRAQVGIAESGLLAVEAMEQTARGNVRPGSVRDRLR